MKEVWRQQVNKIHDVRHDSYRDKSHIKDEQVDNRTLIDLQSEFRAKKNEGLNLLYETNGQFLKKITDRPALTVQSRDAKKL